MADHPDFSRHDTSFDYDFFEVDPDSGPQLYWEVRGDKIIRYAYGEPWVEAAMFFDGYGFATAQEAIEDYERRKREPPVSGGSYFM